MKPGFFVEVEGRAYEVVDVARQKIAQRQPHVKVRLKELVSGRVVERTFVSSDELKELDVSLRTAKFLYQDGDEYVFLDSKTYEEYRLPGSSVEEKKEWFIEGVDFEVVIMGDSPVDVRLPNVIEIEVVDTPPGIKGDTESGGSKPATLSNGVVINVPLHIKKGDKIKVNPQTKEYIGRA